ncbi:hypothetical protein [Streptomyces sp. NPDC002962]|uniref:hypothetical protein n=1 Tax=Streptomyces sp. NPDC002962 TaxID=3364674 RepID=UPI0036B557F8
MRLRWRGVRTPDPGSSAVQDAVRRAALGVDVFEGPPKGLVLAEAELSEDEEARAFVPPPRCVAEVTDGVRFTGGILGTASRRELPA